MNDIIHPFCGLNEDGTLTHWKDPITKVDLIFPNQEVVLPNDVVKLRGGGYICFPFGKTPKTKDYEDITLPPHGLPRTGQGLYKGRYYANPTGTSAELEYLKPWAHNIKVSIKPKDGNRTILHSVTITKNVEFDLRAKSYLPLSLGVHPFFSTNGKPFEIIYGDNQFKSDGIQVDKPFFINKVDDKKRLILKIGNSLVIFIKLIEGYDQFCVWTDFPDKYICVEPVTGVKDENYHVLRDTESMNFRCEFSTK